MCMYINVEEKERKKKKVFINCGWHVGHPQLNLNGSNKAESGQQHTAHLSQCKGQIPLYI